MTSDTTTNITPSSERPQMFAYSFFRNALYVAPLALVQTGVYWLLNHYPVVPSRQLPLTWVDREMPFMIWTIWAYFALIAMAVLLPLFVSDRKAFRRLLVAYAFAMGTAWLFFLFLPTHYPRPPLPEDGSWPSMAYRSLLEFDSPECCFPSSHVIVPLLACFALRGSAGLGRAWWLLLSFVCICCLSILTTKQHYLWDLLGGTATTAIGWYASGICAIKQ